MPRWVIGSALGSGFFLYYFLEVAKRPAVFCSDGKFRKFLYSYMPLLNERFWPTIWCFESRAQTMFSTFLRTKFLSNVQYSREILELPDGGMVCLDWSLPKDDKPDTPTMLFLPGLTGESQADYIQGFVRSANSLGVRSVVFNYRGLGGIPLKTPRTYCACNYEDLTEVIDHVKSKYPESPLGCTAVSMGGLVLGNYLAHESEKANKNFKCCLIISVPWNISVAVDSIEQFGLNMLMNRYLASCLTEVVKGLRHVLEPSQKYEMEKVLSSKTIREFDSHFTVKQFGYKDVNDYYENATIHNKIHRVKVPVVCLSAADDPFQPLEGIPVETANLLEHVAIVVTARGGHIGFLEGFWPFRQEEQYLFKFFTQLFTAVFKNPEAFKDSFSEIVS